MVRAEEINMENQEDVLDALCCYEKKPTPDIPPVLDQYLRRVAKTGETLFPWQQLKILFIHKLDSVITQFNQDFPADHLQNCPNVENVKFEEMKKRVVCSLEEFQGAPFTIQRLCELVTEPKKHYKRTDKFLRGIEKNVLVVSTVDPFGRKIVSDSRPMMNGLDMNGYNGNRPENKPHFSSFPSPSSQQTTWPSDRVFSPELSKELSNPLYETDVSPSPNFPPSEGERVQPTLERVEQQTSPQIKSQENVTLPTENMVKTDTSSESLPPDATPSTTGTSDVNTSLRGSDLSEKMMTSEQSNVEPEVKDVQQSSDAVHSTNTTPLDTTCVDNNSKPSNPQSQEREEEDLSVSGDAQDSDQISSSSSLPLSSSPEPIKEPEESASKESELTNVTTSDDTGLEGSANEPASLSVSQDTTSNDSADCAVCVESSTDSVNDTPSVELPLAQSSTVQLDSTTGEDDMETDSTIPSSDSVVDSDQSEKDESQTNNEKESNCEEEVKVESESSSGASEPVATPMEQD